MKKLAIILTGFLLVFSNIKPIIGKTMPTSAALEIHHQIEASNCCHKVSRTASTPQNPSTKNDCFAVCIGEFDRLTLYHESCHGMNENNKNSCNRQMLTERKHRTIVRLEQVCGKPLGIPENDEMWECLLLSKYLSDIDETLLRKVIPKSIAKTKIHFGMNPAKRFCCDRAEGEMCRQLCYKTYSNDWLESSSSFGSYCQHFWDYNLRQCLQDSDSVCRYGCESKMRFCHHYNNQFRLFRHCNKKTDLQAEKTYLKWLSSNVIQNSIVPGIELHFQNMTKCRSDAWRRLACHLHVQPCVPSTHSSNICRSSCVELIRECLDYEQNINVEPKMVCQVLAELDSESINNKNKVDSKQTTRSNKDCIDFVYENNPNHKILSKTKQKIESKHIKNDIDQDNSRIKDKNIQQKWAFEATPSARDESQNVCFESDCFLNNQICYRTRVSNECFARSTVQKRCQKTCVLGKLKEWQISQGDTISVPTTTSLVWNKMDMKYEEISKNKCSNICRCNIIPSVRSRIRLNNNNENESLEDHAITDSFNENQTELECDFYCLFKDSKLDLEKILSKNAFFDNVQFEFKKNESFSYIDYLPLCMNILLQKRNDYPEIRFCRMTSIKSGKSREYFLPFYELEISENHDFGVRLLCFSSNLVGIENPITQIIYARDVFSIHGGIVCDNNGDEHSVETFFHTKTLPISLAYPGQCLSCCSLYGPVCGRDGRNYPSDCVARSYRVGIDYPSLCSNTRSLCPRISPGCPLSLQQIIPGTRCPFCGSVAYFLIEPFLSNIIPTEDAYLFVQKYSDKLTISSVVEQLHQLSSINCEILAHKPIENILAVSFIPEYSSNPTVYQTRSKFCNLEMKRIVTLFIKRSPRIELWFPLKLLHYDSSIEQKLKQTFIKQSNHSPQTIIPTKYVFIVCFTFLFFV